MIQRQLQAIINLRDEEIARLRKEIARLQGENNALRFCLDLPTNETPQGNIVKTIKRGNVLRVTNWR